VLTRDLSSIVSTLESFETSEHFKIWYRDDDGAVRNISFINPRELAVEYARQLEDLYRTLSYVFKAKEMSPEPIPVYMFDTEQIFPAHPGGFTSFWKNRVFIALPESIAHTGQARARIRPVAFTQGLHALALGRSDPFVPEMQAWLWFDNALAQYLADRSPNAFMNLSWGSGPQVSLCGLESIGAAVKFLSFLELKKGIRFLGRVWEADRLVMSPMEAIDALAGLGRGRLLAEFYASLCLEYAAVGWPIYNNRFQLERLPIRSATEAECLKWVSLDRCACCYYDIVHRGARKFTVKIEFEHSSAPLFALVLAVREWDTSDALNDTYALSPLRNGSGISITIAPGDYEGALAVLLLVVNYGHLEALHHFGPDHHDRRSFAIDAFETR